MKTCRCFSGFAATVILVVGLLSQGANVTANGGLRIPFIRHIVGSITGNGAHSVYAIDLDGDGDMDILGAGGYSPYNGEIAWWENDGSESFEKHSIDDEFINACSVYATDLDRDGDIDVLGAASGDSDIVWWENDGSENFTEHVISSFFSGAYAVYATDVDDDGDIDVLGAASTADDITWWENDGNQSFAAHTIDGSFDGAHSVYATDVDGDGDIDVLGAASDADDVAWWENDGSESFAKHAISSDFDGARSVYAADVDKDGDIDVLGAASTADDLTWWENDGTPTDGGWTEHTLDGNFDDAWSVYAQDVNADGELDILGAGHDDLAWWENDGSEGFTKRTIASNCYGAESVYATDVDGDQDIDALCAADHSYVFIWYEQGAPVQDIFLPLALNVPPPPSSAPVLDAISNPEGARSFTVSWSAVNGATGYVLQQDDNSAFSSPTTAYSGSNTSTTVAVEDVGTFYYRVQATNSSGSGLWSNTVDTIVTQTAVVPRPGYWSGGRVSFDVSSDSSTVEWFDLDVYISGCGTYTLRWKDLPITNGRFSKGKFSTPTSASGSCSYAFQACNGWALGTVSWSATWKHSVSSQAEP